MDKILFEELSPSESRISKNGRFAGIALAIENEKGDTKYVAYDKKLRRIAEGKTMGEVKTAVTRKFQFEERLNRLNESQEKQQSTNRNLNR